jgi:hypothetical protein
MHAGNAAFNRYLSEDNRALILSSRRRLGCVPHARPGAPGATAVPSELMPLLNSAELKFAGVGMSGILAAYDHYLASKKTPSLVGVGNKIG